jgi:small subunit ribosomal protein S2
MVSVIADAIVEAKGGVLETAYQEEEAENDITMKDVMINVEQQAAEYERRKRQRYEERRAQMQNRSRFNHDGQSGERRVFRRDNNRNNPARQGGAGAPKAEAPKTEEVKAAPAADVKEAAE